MVVDYFSMSSVNFAIPDFCLLIAIGEEALDPFAQPFFRLTLFLLHP
jgi:hypothetical protein